MPTILLVDDEKMITEPLARSLRDAGYDVLVAHDGRSGLALAAAHNPDLVVLDVLMPEMDGWEACRTLRQRSPVPILMLTALGEEVDRILGLELGADDYLTKPFSARELKARIRALLRRVELDQAPAAPSGVLTAGDVRLDLNTHQAFKADEEIVLRHKEFELLSLLLARAGQVVTRAELFDRIWGTDWLGDTRTLDVHIRWLREKIEANPSQPEYIQTVRGVGYRLVPPEAAP
ncbi:MAG: response regulator transcription factor [Anaerolineales bacterium]|nr:response regulator transcription factor [Anaerolineales bacterium]